MENKLVLLMCIVNGGYSDSTMELAKRLGARGGTIFNASGSASIDAEKLYGITVNPEKEVIMLIVTSKVATDILNEFYDELGSDTDAQGIAFTLPVNDATSNLTKQYVKK